MTALDPDDFAHDDEAQHLQQTGPEPDEDECAHPPGARVRDDDGTEVCTDCGAVLVGGVIAANRAEAEAATEAPSPLDSEAGVLRHIPWGQNARPYTPEDVEHEILDYVARLNSGARFLAAREKELGEASIAFEIKYARSLIKRTERSAEMRKAGAMGECEEEWMRKTVLEQVVRTTREGMHTLRQQLMALQTVNRSVSSSSGAQR